MRAMILAAGFGGRMGHLVRKMPKPLIPVKGRALIVHHLEKLAQIGVRDVVINVSYLGHLIQDALGDGERYGVRIHYSVEPKPLGLVSGISKALPLLGVDPFILISCDVWTDYSFRNLLTQAIDQAYLVMVQNDMDHPTGDFHLDEAGHIQLDGIHRLTYAGIGLMRPELFEGDMQGKTFIDVLIPAINAARVAGEKYKGRWQNINNEQQLKQAEQADET